MEVVIDGIRYIPDAQIKPPEDGALDRAIQELVSMLYLRDHKPYAHAWDALNALAPNIAELVTDDPAAAFQAVHPHTRD